MTKKKNVDKISRLILSLNNHLIIKFHCRLTKEVNGVVRSFHNFFTYGGGTYLNLEQIVYLTIEIKQDLTAWNSDQRISLTSKNIHQFLSSLKYMINLCMHKQDIYNYTTQADGSDKINISKNIIEKYIIKLQLIGDEMPRIIMHPSVRMDDSGYKEAIRIYFNRKTIYYDITIDEAESLYYNLSKVDFFQYGMSMIQYYVSSVENDKIEVTETNTRKHIMFNDSKQEKTISFIEKDKSDREFFEL